MWKLDHWNFQDFKASFFVVFGNLTDKSSNIFDGNEQKEHNTSRQIYRYQFNPSTTSVRLSLDSQRKVLASVLPLTSRYVKYLQKLTKIWVLKSLRFFYYTEMGRGLKKVLRCILEDTSRWLPVVAGKRFRNRPVVYKKGCSCKILNRFWKIYLLERRWSRPGSTLEIVLRSTRNFDSY